MINKVYGRGVEGVQRGGDELHRTKEYFIIEWSTGNAWDHSTERSRERGEGSGILLLKRHGKEERTHGDWSTEDIYFITKDTGH